MNVLDLLNTLSTLGFPSVMAILAFLYRHAFKKQLKFSPALAFAYSYFNNFITPLYARLAGPTPLQVGEQPIDKVFIRVPPSLYEATNQSLAALKNDFERQGHPLVEEAVETPQGKRTILVKTEAADKKLLFDVPRILANTEFIINDMLGGARQEKQKKWQKIEAQELLNFELYLTSLILKHQYQDRIKLFLCSVADLTEEEDLIAERRAQQTWLRRLFNKLFRRS